MPYSFLIPVTVHWPLDQFVNSAATADAVLKSSADKRTLLHWKIDHTSNALRLRLLLKQRVAVSEAEEAKGTIERGQAAEMRRGKLRTTTANLREWLQSKWHTA